MKSWELHPYLMYWPSLSQYVWNISTKLRTLRITSLKYPTYMYCRRKQKIFSVDGWYEISFFRLSPTAEDKIKQHIVAYLLLKFQTWGSGQSILIWNWQSLGLLYMHHTFWLSKHRLYSFWTWEEWALMRPSRSFAWKRNKKVIFLT